MDDDVTVRGIITAVMDLMRDSSREVLIYTLGIGGLTALGVIFGVAETTAMSVGFGFSVDANDGPLAGLFELLVAVASVVAGYLLLSRYLAARGRLRDDSNRFWPYLGLAILSTIGIVLGLILLIVPGIMLMVRWSAASGFVIGEQLGITDSLKASWDATKGHGWAIFLSALVMFVGILVVAAIIGAIFVALNATAGAVVSALLEAAANAVALAFGIAIYCQVHRNSGQVAEVFA